MGMTFHHRPGELPWIQRVWWCRSAGETSMTSVARAEWDLVLCAGPDGVSVSLQGAESAASRAPVPPASSFVGVRFALGVSLAAHPAATIVDTSVPLGAGDDGLLGRHGAGRLEAGDAEGLVSDLVARGVLVTAELPPRERTTRTAQRHHRASTGLTHGLVRQIDRARSAAAWLRAGEAWPAVVDEFGYVDQAHLCRSMRRFVGHTPGELGADDPVALSFLYKTSDAEGS
jgi:hypothetical protein